MSAIRILVLFLKLKLTCELGDSYFLSCFFSSPPVHSRWWSLACDWLHPALAAFLSGDTGAVSEGIWAHVWVLHMVSPGSGTARSTWLLSPQFCQPNCQWNSCILAKIIVSALDVQNWGVNALWQGPKAGSCKKTEHGSCWTASAQLTSSHPCTAPEVPQDQFWHSCSCFGSTCSIGLVQQLKLWGELTSELVWFKYNTLLPSGCLNWVNSKFGFISQTMYWHRRGGGKKQQWDCQTGTMVMKRIAHWIMHWARSFWICWGKQPLPANYCYALIEGMLWNWSTFFSSQFFSVFFFSGMFSLWIPTFLFNRLNHRQVIDIQWVRGSCFHPLPTNTLVVKKCLEEWSFASDLEAEVHHGAIPPSLAWVLLKAAVKNPCSLAKIMNDLQTQTPGSVVLDAANLLRYRKFIFH